MLVNEGSCSVALAVEVVSFVCVKERQQKMRSLGLACAQKMAGKKFEFSPPTCWRSFFLGANAVSASKIIKGRYSRPSQ